MKDCLPNHPIRTTAKGMGKALKNQLLTSWVRHKTDRHWTRADSRRCTMCGEAAVEKTRYTCGGNQICQEKEISVSPNCFASGRIITIDVKVIIDFRKAGEERRWRKWHGGKPIDGWSATCSRTCYTWPGLPIRYAVLVGYYYYLT